MTRKDDISRFAIIKASRLVNERITQSCTVRFCSFIVNDVKHTGVNFDRVSRSRKLHRADDAAAGNKRRDQSAAMPLKNRKPRVSETRTMRIASYQRDLVPPPPPPSGSVPRHFQQNIFYPHLLSEPFVPHAVDSKRSNFSNFPRIARSEFDTQSSRILNSTVFPAQPSRTHPPAPPNPENHFIYPFCISRSMLA